MKLILACHNNSEFGGRCDYAFLDLPPGVARLILLRKASFDTVKSHDEDLTSIAYWDRGPVWFSGRHLPEGEDGWYESVTDTGVGGSFRVVEGVSAADFEDMADRTEGDRMLISDACVWFDAYPEHCDYTVETHPIDYSTIRRAAAEEEEESQCSSPK